MPGNALPAGVGVAPVGVGEGVVAPPSCGVGLGVGVMPGDAVGAPLGGPTWLPPPPEQPASKAKAMTNRA
jgi:hypothetical protein